MSFNEILELHIKSIKERNIDKFASTISKEIYMILPNAKVITGYDHVIDFHRSWFGDPDWSMKLDKIAETIYDDLAILVYDVVYKDLDENGHEYELNYLLSLHFKKLDEGWKLIFDQNTRK